MRSRQYLGCLRVRNGLLSLEQMYFADEVDEPEDVLPEALPKVAKRELDMGLSLIQSFAGEWEPEKYSDTYRDALMAIVDEKRKGHEVHRIQEPDEEESPPDLMEALRLSLEQVEGGRPRKAKRNGGRTKAKARAAK
jgi:DNA end-binding protein Ku